MKLNDTVQRQDNHTKEWGVELLLTSQGILDYHRELEEKGIVYRVKPTIHKSDGVCLNCEG